MAAAAMQKGRWTSVGRQRKREIVTGTRPIRMGAAGIGTGREADRSRSRGNSNKKLLKRARTGTGTGAGWQGGRVIWESHRRQEGRFGRRRGEESKCQG